MGVPFGATHEGGTLVSTWLLKTFGIPVPSGSTFAGLAFQWLQPWPLFLTLMAFLVVIVGVSWTYEMTRKPLSRWTKSLLSGLRILAGLLILILIFEPIAHIKFSTDQRAHVITLFDVSQSIGLKDPHAGYRVDVLNRALGNPDLKLLPSLRDRYEVNAWSFASQVRQIELKKEALAFPTFQIDRTPEGQRSRIGDALMRAYGELRGEQVAGVIVVSDGQSTDGEDPMVAAYLFKQSKIPIFTVGVGDSTLPKDVRLMDPIASEEVYLGDSILVQADVVHTGFKGRSVMVRVYRDKTREMGRTEVTLGPDREKQRVTINVVADESGIHDYLVKVEPLGEELSVDNNAKLFRVKVSEEKMKVLYVEREPRRLFRFFKAALHREPTIEFSALLQTAPSGLQESKGMTSVKSFPSSREALLRYDVLVLGDIELKKGFFKKEQLEMIKNYVEEGRGLLVIAGDGHDAGTPWNFRNTPLEDLMPVSLDEAQREGVTYVGKKGFKAQLTSEGVNHVIMKVKDEEEEVRKFWNEFDFTWAAKVGRPKEGTTVLAVHPDRLVGNNQPLPLFVLGRPGVGKVAYIGLSEFWRLRHGTEDTIFWTRFFRPLLHWLSPPKGAGTAVDLRLDRRTYQGGEKVRITAALHKAGMLKLTRADVLATVQDEAGAKEEVSLAEESDGVYTGAFVPQHGGKHQVWISQAKGADGVLEETKVSFFVEVPNLEFEHPEMNETLLKDLAQLTGGQYYPMKDIGKMLSVVLTKPAQVLRSQQKELHDTPLAVIALVSFFSAEWYLRRKRGLL